MKSFQAPRFFYRFSRSPRFVTIWIASAGRARPARGQPKREIQGSGDLPKPVDRRGKREQGRDVAAFLDRVARMPAVRAARERGRLIFALDATMSREATWDRASQLQAALLDRMTAVGCRGGYTQIARVLRHIIEESRGSAVNAAVYIGDSVEEEPDALCRQAGELGMLGIPLFIFQEGTDPTASRVFAEMARLSGGAHCPFDGSSAGQLRALLRAVAVYAAGGRQALLDYGAGQSGPVRRLIAQLK